MIIADTGFVVSVTLTTDRFHQRCLALYRLQPRIIMPASVLVETAYTLSGKAGSKATARFLQGLAATTRYQIVDLTPDDIQRAAQLLEKYADTHVDFVDASVAAIAERLKS